MSKYIGIILTFTLLVAALVIIGTYMTTSMSATSQGVNLSNSSLEIQSAYNASQRNAVATIAVSHYTVYLVGIFAVIITLAVLMAMVQSNRKRG